MAQPLMSLLTRWGQSTAQIAGLTALLWLPWALKPIYGLISDLFPLAGHHRKSYLIAASGLTCASLFALYALGPPDRPSRSRSALLLPATIGVAFSDVVIDALMVEKGQPRGLTGRFQSVQWTALYGASIVCGSLGGY